MSKIRGFKLRKHLIRVSGWIFRKARIMTRPGCHRLSGSSQSLMRKPITRLLKWGHKLTAGARSFCGTRSGSGYTQLRSDPDPCVPKGHLAVYVGQKDGEFHRVFVPVIYFNHPLFSELLKETEEEYGFHHPGGITIPCRYTEFERVKTRIASVSGGGIRPI